MVCCTCQRWMSWVLKLTSSGGKNGAFKWRGMPAAAPSSCPYPLPSCIPWAPWRRHAPSRQILCGQHGQGSLSVPLTKVVSAHAWHAILSTVRYTRGGLWIFMQWWWWGWCWHQWGGRPSLTSVSTREGSSPPRSCWRWGSSSGGYSRSTSSLTGMVPATSLGLNQLASLFGTSSVCHVGGGNW